MKKTEKQELKNLSQEELAEKVEVYQRELFSLRLHSATSPLKDNQKSRRIRKDIARALTYLNKSKRTNNK
jgi:ribosomal protein L29